jgi:type IV secretory pathway VirB2 component (pilin)
MLANIQVVYIDVVLSLFNITGEWENKLCLVFGILSTFPSASILLSTLPIELSSNLAHGFF